MKKKKKCTKFTKKQAELLHAQPMNNSLEFSMHTFKMWIEAHTHVIVNDNDDDDDNGGGCDCNEKDFVLFFYASK